MGEPKGNVRNETKKLLLTLFTRLAQPFNPLARQSDESGYFWMNRRAVA